MTIQELAAVLGRVQAALDAAGHNIAPNPPDALAADAGHKLDIAANVVRELRRKLDRGLGAEHGVRFRPDGEPEPISGPVRRRPRLPGMPPLTAEGGLRHRREVLDARDALRAAAREAVRAFPERRAIAEKFDGAVRRVDDAALWLDGACAGKVPPTLTAIFGEPPPLDLAA